MNIISIIVPVYNCEKYFERCIKSLVAQTYENIEIILVDDGSTDGSGALCDNWAQKDNRIRTIHKNNEGLGFARNTGLDAAKGDYLLFVDSDDYIMPQTCEKALKRIVDTDSDLCIFGFIEDYEFYDGRPSKERHLNNICEIYDGKSVIDDFLANSISQSEKDGDMPTISMSAWSCFYKSSVLKENNVRFYSERTYLSEDLLFRVDLCKYICRVVSLDECLYCYCHNAASLTTNYRPDRLDAAYRLYKKLLDETKDYLSDDGFANRCKRLFLNNVIACLKQEIVHCNELGRKVVLRHIKQICCNNGVESVLKEYPINQLPKKLKALFYAMKYHLVRLVYIIVSVRVKKIK